MLADTGQEVPVSGRQGAKPADDDRPWTGNNIRVFDGAAGSPGPTRQCRSSR
jgi:hypothetical protein